MTREEQLIIYKYIMQYAFQVRIGNDTSPRSKTKIKFDDIPNITYLHFWNKGLEYLIDEIGLLMSLKGLKLTKNKLSNLPETFSNLTSLEELDLSDNNFSSIPSVIFKLTQLESLKLANNKLQTLPIEILGFNFNKYETANWTKGNSFIEPSSEIICGGLEAIKVFFEDMKEETQQVNEIKVLFVGDGGAGKTSLINRLIFNNFDSEEEKTNGIVKQEYKFENIVANFWDFGGQTIYHSTHQFFLSKRSIYILVLDGRKEQEEEYWLKMIENFGAGSKVFVILNKIDDNQQASLDEKFLRYKYSNIVDFIKISCKNNIGIDELKVKLENEIKKSEIIKEELPKSWFNTKEELEKMTEDFLNYDSFEKICDKNSVKKESQGVLIQFLHDLGVILNFGNDFKLKHTHIINPDWATEGVYKIINSKELCDYEGLLLLQSLSKILDTSNYPIDKHIYLIELMKKFELCFEKDNDYILIPELLPKHEPDFLFDKTGNIKFRIKYDFLPKASITRFIVNEHNLIFNGLVWRKGVVLEDKTLNTMSIIREDKVDKRIDIIVFGEQKREFLSKIRATFHKINESFQTNKIEEQVLLPDNEDIAINFEHLLFLEKENEVSFYPEGAAKKYFVSELLDGFIRRDEKERFYVGTYINGDNFENVEQNNQSSGSIGGKSVKHTTNNINKEFLELIEAIKNSKLHDKNEIVEELKNNVNDDEKVQKILGTLMSRGAETVTLIPYISSFFQSILPF